MALAPDGRLATGSTDRTTRIYQRLQTMDELIDFARTLTIRPPTTQQRQSVMLSYAATEPERP